MDDLVISGMSGRFPDSDNVDELRNNLFSGKDMISEDHKRWQNDFHSLQSRMGKIKDLTKFDTEFFRVNPNQAQNMDVKTRLLIEVTYEAIIDAGYNPEKLRGHKIGVYIGTCSYDYCEAIHSDLDSIDNYTVMGSLHNLLANRISYTFDWNGPSYVIDSACSSSLQALYLAYSDLRLGKIDKAIVGGATVNLGPAMSVKFLKYNMLSKEGRCKSFDESADGYVRSEAVSTILLERRTTAKRIYGTVVNINSNNDGYKSEGLGSPSFKGQSELMTQTINEVDIRPDQVIYIETHGTGTQAGDKVEIDAIQEVYCKNRKVPIKIGSVKSNLGHSEGASGVCSLIKVLISIQNEQIPANINYSVPNPKIPALINGQVLPVIENTELIGDYLIAINSFGMGGTNVHVLIRPEKIKPKETVLSNRDIPRLILVHGRTESSVKYILDFIDNNPQKVSNDFLTLLNEIKNGPTPKGMDYKGFMIHNKHLGKENNIEIVDCLPHKRQVWLILSGMGSQWKNMIEGLMDLPIFDESIRRCAQYLKPFGLDLIDLLTTDENQFYDTFMSPCVGISAVQIALIDSLNALDFNWDGIIGHSAGEMLCAYATGVLTAEEVMKSKYQFAKLLMQSKLPLSQMAAVGLTWEETKNRCPPNVYPACHNSKNSVTISGLHSETNVFMDKLKDEHIFVKSVDSCGYAFHCPIMASLRDSMTVELKPYIPRKKRPQKWLSSSHDINQWNNDEAIYSSAEYYSNNMVAEVLFHQCVEQIPKDAIVIEVAPDSLFRNILHQSIGPEISYVGLMKRNNGVNNLTHLLSSIGRLYNLGLNPKIEKLYPKTELPVRKGTQSLSPLIKWDHSEQWYVPQYFNNKFFENKQAQFEDSQKDSVKNQDFLLNNEIPNTSLYLDKIKKILGMRKSMKVKPEKPLFEMGMDSMMGVQILDIINKELKRDITLEELAEMRYEQLMEMLKF